MPPEDLVVALHDDLQRWLADADQAALQRFLNAHHPAMRLIDTSGRRHCFDDLARALAASGGSRPGLHITIDDVHRPAANVVAFMESHHHPASDPDSHSDPDSGGQQRRWTTMVLTDGKVIAVQETQIR
ncbi:hypothetical protein [Nakamurella aerolata]|uniref:SnoaL-like domain-containing protein n=1 Tax=Nakamurella aerolata TaxID=1656892 RepID=A0A849A4J4_9ACTN|nr:hypothetical protein [Nakamurella aerolata]NNG34566.1 hypothetical protein [Nakamurella aerolata]